MIEQLIDSVSVCSSQLPTAKSFDPVLLNGWHVLARSQDLGPNTPLHCKLLGMDIVLWRDANHQIHAWKDCCPHRGTLLSSGKIINNQLVCPYHGLAFNPDGQCSEIPSHPNSLPARALCVSTYCVQECYDLVFVCLGQPTQALPQFSEWDHPDYRRFLCTPFECHASAWRVMENFFDVAHFPFVHAGLLGDPNRPMTNEYNVSQNSSGLAIEQVQFWQPNPDGTGTGRLITNTYRLLNPLTVHFVKEFGDQRVIIFFTLTATEEETCQGWMWIAMNYAHDVSETELRAFQDQIIAQDRAIVELQRPRRLPLNLKAEFHLPCDRASIAYRKWLTELGITFGTILP